jgi:DNA-binding NarL/FixJ family response regulator
MAMMTKAQPLVGKRRIFIVDDHPIVRQGLTQLLNSEPDLIISGQGEDVYKSLAAIRQDPPDMALVDVSLKDGDGIELIKELRGLMPDLPTLVLSMHDEQIYAERALRAGARGFVMKQEPPDTLLSAIRLVLKGGVYVSDRMRDSLLRRDAEGNVVHDELPMDRLTDRELEIFRMIGGGLSVKEIATKLILSTKTVEAHREHIKAKLGFRSSSELFRFAIRNAPGST